MTKQEIQKKSSDKVKAVEVLLRRLSLSAQAAQRVNEHGVIENVVFYIDNENYPLDKTVTPPVENKKND